MHTTAKRLRKRIFKWNYTREHQKSQLTSTRVAFALSTGWNFKFPSFLPFFSNVCALLLLLYCVCDSQYFDIYREHSVLVVVMMVLLLLLLLHGLYFNISCSAFVVYVLFSICSKCECLRCRNRTWTTHVHITQSYNTAEHVQHISSGCYPLLLLLLLLLWFETTALRVPWMIFSTVTLECERQWERSEWEQLWEYKSI